MLGKSGAYIVFALALNNQALTQKSASYRKVQDENEKFAMRVYLNRIGFIGDEFKAAGNTFISIWMATQRGVTAARKMSAATSIVQEMEGTHMKNNKERLYIAYDQT